MLVYYDVHCKFDTSSYSIPVEINTDEILTVNEVISYCKQHNLFTDENYVDYVTIIDKEDYLDLKGC